MLDDPMSALCEMQRKEGKESARKIPTFRTLLGGRDFLFIVGQGWWYHAEQVSPWS